MKQCLTNLMKDPCRHEPVTDQLKEAFPHIKFLQRYHPGLDAFPLGLSEPLAAALPTRYSIQEWLSTDPSDSRFRTVRVADTTTDVSSETSSDVSQEATVFVKTVHLLDPIALLQNEYTMPAHPLLPLGTQSWKNTLLKLHTPTNQAYVDAVASYVLGRLREQNMTPHAALSYGSITGIADRYKFKITDEYDSYRQCRWFWKGLKTKSATLEVKRDEEDVLADPEYTDLVQEMFVCPFDDLDGCVAEEEELCLEKVEAIEDSGSLHSFDFDLEEEESSEKSDKSEGTEESDCSDCSDCSDESSDGTLFDVNLNMTNMPVIMICQEAQQGTMDDLMDEEELHGNVKGSGPWDQMWIAWTFQIVAALSFLQKHVAFTHNDLHTNNIVWRTTDQTHLYYRAHDGTTFKVPTYGRIFSLIDFGRAIFRIQGELWISDDHWPDHDAGGQYNFGPFYDSDSPKVSPNPSFDLCRLAISMLEGLYDEHPSRKKGSTTILSQEGSWKVHETVSPLFNLLWSWTLNDDGETLFEDRHGNEKFPGFDLYIEIAHKVHDAVPKDQVRRPVFESFRYKGKVGSDTTVYSI